jgi:hypothetical protein
MLGCMPSKTEVREFLLTSYGEFKRNGCVSYSGDQQAIARYSHPEMARRFAEILDSGAIGVSSESKRTDVTLEPNRSKQTVL